MKTEAMFYERLPEGAVRCRLCAHRCFIRPGKRGFCGVRQNEAGTLFTHAYGATVARSVDPVEKKPLYHFLPGTRTYSVATSGCNFRCGFCQNWQISQIGAEAPPGIRKTPLTPGNAVDEARRNACASIAYTYTEPTIFFEYAREIALAAKPAALKNIFVTNGYMTQTALEDAAGWLDAANVDLKAWNDEYYRQTCNGRLQPVRETIAAMKSLGIWVEVTTLIVPGLNDARKDLEGIAGFIAGVGEETPWHISRFHPDFNFVDQPPTPMATLIQAERIGRRAGLRYVYPGNVGGRGDTQCPECGETVIRRTGMIGEAIHLHDGRCPSCGGVVDGVWR